MVEFRSSSKLRISFLSSAIILALLASSTLLAAILLYVHDFDLIGKYILTLSVFLSLSVLFFCWSYLYLSGRLRNYFTTAPPIMLHEFIHVRQEMDVGDKKSNVPVPVKDELPPKYNTLPAPVSANELPTYREYCGDKSIGNEV